MRSLVIFCHPDPASLIAAACDRVVTTLAAGGEVRVTDLYAVGFAPSLTAAEEAAHLETGAEPDIEPHVRDLQWCDQLVLVYPTWWGGQPAMLKGWIDRVWVRGAVWDLPLGGNRIEPRLHNVRRIVAVTTHGSSKWINVVQGEPGKRVITRTLRSVCGWRTTTTWIALYGVDRASDAARTAFLDEIPRRVGTDRRRSWVRRRRR